MKIQCWLVLALGLPLVNAAAGTLPVVASNSIVGDIVTQIGGDRIDLTLLAAAGVDPHGFDPSPQDAKRIHNAAVIFLNGAGLDANLDRLIEAAGSSAKTCTVSDGIAFLDSLGEPCSGDHDETHEHTHHEGPHDPHVWFDPLRVKTWGTNIAARLTALDPEGATYYTERRARLDESLTRLHEWVQAELNKIPPQNRRFAADHQVFGYLADRYGFPSPLTLNEGFSSVTQPDVRAVVELIREIRRTRAKAILVGVNVNAEVARQVALETHIPVVRLHTCALGGPGSGATTYEDFIRHNISTLAEALR